MAAKTKQTRPTSARQIEGSPEAMKLAVAILETLSGLVSPAEASAGLGISVNRYYQLETRALEGLVRAMEPRPRGRTLTAARERDRLKAENEKLKQELLRYQALTRTAQRTIGLAPKGPKRAGSARRRRPRVRAKTVLKQMAPQETPEVAEGRTA